MLYQSIGRPLDGRDSIVLSARREGYPAGVHVAASIKDALALAAFGEDIDAMMVLVDRALALNPGYARGWHVSGFLRLWAGQTDLAIEHAAVALLFLYEQAERMPVLGLAALNCEPRGLIEQTPPFANFS